MKIKVKEIVSYKGHSLTANGCVDLKLVASYHEATNSMKILQMLNNDIVVKAKIADGKPMLLGTFRVKKVIFDGDGESVIKFNGLNDFIEMDNLNVLPLNEDEEKLFTILMETETEEE